MFWIGVLVGLFVGAFLGLFFGGLLAAAKQGDDLVAAALARESVAESSPANDKIT
jgi:putative effector of murein hydrolase